MPVSVLPPMNLARFSCEIWGKNNISAELSIADTNRLGPVNKSTFKLIKSVVLRSNFQIALMTGASDDTLLQKKKQKSHYEKQMLQ